MIHPLHKRGGKSEQAHSQYNPEEVKDQDNHSIWKPQSKINKQGN